MGVWRGPWAGTCGPTWPGRWAGAQPLRERPQRVATSPTPTASAPLLGGAARASVTPVPTPRVSTPHYSPGLLIQKTDAYTKVYSRAGLALMWNREDSVMVRRGGGSGVAGGRQNRPRIFHRS